MNYCLGFKKGRKGETVLRGYTRINIKGKTPITFLCNWYLSIQLWWHRWIHTKIRNLNIIINQIIYQKQQCTINIKGRVQYYTKSIMIKKNIYITMWKSWKSTVTIFQYKYHKDKKYHLDVESMPVSPFF